MTLARAVRRRRTLVKAPEREWRGTTAWLLTCGTLGRAPLFGQNPELAERALHAAHDVAAQCDLVLDGMCVMPDHVHILLQAGRKSVETPAPFVHAWRGTIEEQWQRGGGRGVWQENWNMRALTQPVDHCLALDYTVQNPVRAGLAAEWAAYAWTFSRFHAESPWRPHPVS